MNGLVWFRNDLRSIDNQSLYYACRENEKVIGIYCLDPRQFETTQYGFKKTEKFRTQFLLETLDELQQNLKEKKITLLVYYGYPEQLIPEIAAKYQIDSIYIQNEWTQEEVDVETEVRNQIPAVNWKTYCDQFLFHPDDVPYEDWEKIPEVFTEFRKQLEKKIRVRPTVAISAKPISNLIEEKTSIPTLEDLGFENFKQPNKTAFPFKGGENQAKKRIKEYFWDTKKLAVYKKTRNGLVGKDYSSKLSAWLANGSISARTIYWEVQQYEKKIVKNEDTYWLIFELIWRDYFKFISLKHGNKLFKLSGILEKENKLEWALFKATRVLHLTKTPALSRMDLPIGGGVNIINATTENHGPSWRMVVHLTDEIEAYGLYPGGQSGNPGSPYYDTFVNYWAEGKYYRLLFLSKEKLKKSERKKWHMQFQKTNS